jgi:hypothetical protein
LEVAIAKAASALVNTVAIEMYGDGGHVVGFKIVDGGTSSFFDANAGLYQFLSVDDLKNFCLGAYAIADYHFIPFNVVSFGKMPMHDRADATLLKPPTSRYSLQTARFAPATGDDRAGPRFVRRRNKK